MNIVKITGGLGNQMFQYAFAKALESKYSSATMMTENNQVSNFFQNQNKVFLDLSAYNQKKEQNGINLVHNGFELEYLFNISFEQASLKDINRLSIQPTSLFNRFRRKYFTKKTHFIDTKFNYNESVFKSQSITKKVDTYYDGYWQTERYFEEISDKIRKEFTFKLPLEEKNQKLLDETSNKKRVSIHIRRGDYLNSENLNVCTKQYYHNALTKLFEIDIPEEIWIFSDDIDWCIKELKLEKLVSNYFNKASTNNLLAENHDLSDIHFSTSYYLPKITYIDWNKAENSWQDMALMSNCTSHIIANSSFSWWGAWLDNSPNKIVIAPKPWNMRELHNKDSYYHHDYADIVPSSWLRVGIN